MAPIFGVDPREIESSGWGVIFVEGEQPAVRAALAPLLEHRRQQTGELYRDFEYHRGESKTVFLSRHGAGPGPADPSHVPYYLLLVGDPAAISFQFQSELDLQYAVGRIHFDTIEEYRSYAKSVVEVETRESQLPKRLALFGVKNEGDQATARLAEELVAPLARQLAKVRNDWKIDLVEGTAATKAKLSMLLGGKETPAFLLIGAHGMEFRSGEEKQKRQQGAVICSDWKGPVQENQGPVQREVYFSADDVPEEAELNGVLVFAFGCFTAGTPDFDNFDMGASPRRLAPDPFVSSLAKRLLGHPRGGALAVIGNIDRSWTLSWHMGPEGPQIGTFLSSIANTLDGQPIGHAMEYFNHRYAELAAQVNHLLAERNKREHEDSRELTRLWTATVDAQNFVVLGDPAVKIADISMDPAFKGIRRREIAGEGKKRKKRKLSPKEEEKQKNEVVQLGGRFGALNDDIPTEDQLGYRYYVQAFADLIASPDTSPPLTIGILGSWGVGKTFILEHIKRELERHGREAASPTSRTKVHIINFNAWEYSANEKIWPGLVRKIMDGMERYALSRIRGLWARVKRNFTRQFQKEQGKILFILIFLGVSLAIIYSWPAVDFRMAAQAAAILMAGGILKFASDILSNPLSGWVVKLFEREDYGRMIGYMEEIADDLKYLDRYMKEGERILLIVDDLDRCEPSRAVEMLQAIKLLLDFNRFIVLVGIDARIISCAVEKHYEGLLGKAGASGYEYLDKIIQIPFRIPRPSHEDMEFFVSQLMENPPELDRQQRFSEAAQGAAERFGEGAPLAGGQRASSTDGNRMAAPDRPLEGQDAEGGGAPLAEESLHVSDVPDLSFTQRELVAFHRLIPYINRNPRYTKRLVNVYRLVRAIANRKRDLIVLRNPDAAIQWVLLCLQWPERLHRMLKELEVVLRSPVEERNWTHLNDDPLQELLNRIKSDSMDKQEPADDDFRRLEWLLTDSEIPRVDLIGLRRLERYAIHLRPWVDSGG